jgi:hypothetical protein
MGPVGESVPNLRGAPMSRCEKGIMGSNIFHSRSCSHTALEGSKFCKLHQPENIAARANLQKRDDRCLAKFQMELRPRKQVPILWAALETISKMPEIDGAISSAAVEIARKALKTCNDL